MILEGFVHFKDDHIVVYYCLQKLFINIIYFCHYRNYTVLDANTMLSAALIERKNTTNETNIYLWSVVICVDMKNQ